MARRVFMIAPSPFAYALTVVGWLRNASLVSLVLLVLFDFSQAAGLYAGGSAQVRGGDLANSAMLTLLVAVATLLSLVFALAHEIMSRSPALQRSAWSNRTSKRPRSISTSDPQP